MKLWALNKLMPKVITWTAPALVIKDSHVQQLNTAQLAALRTIARFPKRNSVETNLEYLRRTKQLCNSLGDLVLGEIWFGVPSFGR